MNVFCVHILFARLWVNLVLPFARTILALYVAKKSMILASSGEEKKAKQLTEFPAEAHRCWWLFDFGSCKSTVSHGASNPANKLHLGGSTREP